MSNEVDKCIQAILKSVDGVTREDILKSIERTRSEVNSRENMLEFFGRPRPSSSLNFDEEE